MKHFEAKRFVKHAQYSKLKNTIHFKIIYKWTLYNITKQLLLVQADIINLNVVSDTKFNLSCLNFKRSPKMITCLSL